ncbi:MAG: cytidylate kinase family protein, partial [Oscillospiraceae bacterium]|nr:cytidylate kinase family protein [Oscillospiraceae bacterium]
DFKIKRRIALLKEHEGIELSPEDMKKKILFVDKQRARYYEYYTDRKWGNIHNYDICINTAKVSIPEAVDIIAKCLEKDK